MDAARFQELATRFSNPRGQAGKPVPLKQRIISPKPLIRLQERLNNFCQRFLLSFILLFAGEKLKSNPPARPAAAIEKIKVTVKFAMGFPFLFPTCHIQRQRLETAAIGKNLIFFANKNKLPDPMN
ncbi:MAG: hypothetical protein ACE5GQ_01875 [Nitrospinales bacterium]